MIGLFWIRSHSQIVFFCPVFQNLMWSCMKFRPDQWTEPNAIKPGDQRSDRENEAEPQMEECLSSRWSSAPVEISIWSEPRLEQAELASPWLPYVSCMETGFLGDRAGFQMLSTSRDWKCNKPGRPDSPAPLRSGRMDVKSNSTPGLISLFSSCFQAARGEMLTVPHPRCATLVDGPLAGGCRRAAGTFFEAPVWAVAVGRRLGDAGAAGRCGGTGGGLRFDLQPLVSQSLGEVIIHGDADGERLGAGGRVVRTEAPLEMLIHHAVAAASGNHW